MERDSEKKNCLKSITTAQFIIIIHLVAYRIKIINTIVCCYREDILIQLIMLILKRNVNEYS